MKRFMIYDLRFTIVAAMLALAMPCRASLTAKVQPGYQFPLDGSVPLSWSLLNLLATPTVSIYGTVGGSNTLSPSSVTGTELASSIVDNSTIGFNDTYVYIKTAGVFTNNLNTNDWLWPLGQPTAASAVKLNYNPILFGTPTNLLGSGTNTGPLSLNYDTNVWGTNNLGLALAGQTNSVLGTSTNGQTALLALDPNYFSVTTQSNAPGTNMAPTLTLAHPLYSTLTNLVPLVFYSMVATGVLTNAHTLGTVPSVVRVVLACTNAEGNWNAGEEVAMENVWTRTPLVNLQPPAATSIAFTSNAVFSVSADVSNVYTGFNYVQTNGPGAGPNALLGSAWVIFDRKTRGWAFFTPTNWNIKIYVAK